MLLAGIAVTIKTTAVFEATFVGLWCSGVLLRSPWPRHPPARTIAVWALTGAAPVLVIAAAYALAGYWPIYWNAMVTSNFAKPPERSEEHTSELQSLMRISYAVLCLKKKT